MDKVVGIVALLAIYFLVGRRLPARYHLIAIAAALALTVLVLAMESAGVWPEAWTRYPASTSRRSGVRINIGGL
jgi:hypothetical protein